MDLKLMAGNGEKTATVAVVSLKAAVRPFSTV